MVTVCDHRGFENRGMSSKGWLKRRELNKMQRRMMFCAAILAGMTLGIQQAVAYCLDLAPSGYCDLVQVDVINGVVFGTWESNCDGIPDTTVAGTTNFATASFAGDSWKDGIHLFLWDVSVVTKTVDIWQTDGATATQSLNNLQVGLSPGTCPFAAIATLGSGISISQSAPLR